MSKVYIAGEITGLKKEGKGAIWLENIYVKIANLIIMIAAKNIILKISKLKRLENVRAI